MSALRLEILETLPSQTPDDQGLIAQWLADRGFSANTQAAYLGDLHDLLGYIGKSFERSRWTTCAAGTRSCAQRVAAHERAGASSTQCAASFRITRRSCAWRAAATQHRRLS